MAIAIVATFSDLCAQQEGTLKFPPFLLNQSVTVSPPAVGDDGTVYIGIEKSSGRSGGLLAVNPADLTKAKWFFVTPDAVESAPCIGPDGTIYFGCLDGRLYAINPDGTRHWDCDLKAAIGSSPAIGLDGTLYVGADDFALHAVSASGHEQWTFPSGKVVSSLAPTSSPAVGPDGTIYFGSLDKNLYAVTPAGAKKWQFGLTGEIFSSPAIGRDGTIYVGSADQFMYAITPDGAGRWKKFTNGDIQSSPVLGADGTIYFASNDLNFYALAPEEGATRWATRLGTTNFSTAAVRADGVIIVGGDDGIVRALNPDGRIRWIFETKTEDHIIESSPIVAPDGTIYVGSLDGHLYGINGNGSPLSNYSAWPAFQHDRKHTGRAPLPVVAGQLTNIASRAEAGGTNHLVAGFVVQGAAAQRVYLIRAVGPGLAKVGINGFVRDPQLDLFSGELPVQHSDNWVEHDPASQASVPETESAVGAFLLDPGSTDAAIVRPLPGGAFTAEVTSVDGSTGVALVEIYNTPAGDQNARIVNLSTRGQVGTNENILIAGFVVRDAPVKLLLRGIGPALAQFGVPRVLAQPRLEVFDHNRVRIAANTGWAAGGLQGDIAGAAARVAAFPLLESSTDSALIFDAAPGDYTIQISGVGNTTGEAMVEIYVLP